VTPASFEPTIDYVVVKIPRFAFEKFPGASSTLGTQMKSVGEVMAIGGTFKQAFQKGLRGLEIGARGFFLKGVSDSGLTGDALDAEMARPSPDRLFHVRAAFDQGRSIENIHAVTAIDLWFLDQLQQIIDAEKAITASGLGDNAESLRRTKLLGFSDARLGDLTGKSESEVRAHRRSVGVAPVYKRVDTCAAEFESHTPYLYSTYEHECEAQPTTRRKVMILGSGPNRIGQGIEFDYCCCHASFAFHDEGCETIMVNCNPETVSTDYDTSDRLYFEPLTFEDVMNIVEREKPDGVVIQFGGQTPLKLALPLFRAGVPIWGTSPDMIDLAEDRKRFAKLLDELKIPQPESGTALSIDEAHAVAVASAIRSSCVRPTFSAAAPWPSSTPTTTSKGSRAKR
jgi:carbamoyl-phosphate synthase large subunit